MQMWYSIPSLVWFGQIPDPKKRPILKFGIHKFRTFPYENFIFFLEKITRKISARKVLYVLELVYTWDTSCQVRLDSNNFLTPSKWLYWKFKYLMNSQMSVWTANFCPRQSIAKILSVSHSRYLWNTPGQDWFDLNNLWPNQKHYV